LTLSFFICKLYGTPKISRVERLDLASNPVPQYPYITLFYRGEPQFAHFSDIVSYFGWLSEDYFDQFRGCSYA